MTILAFAVGLLVGVAAGIVIAACLRMAASDEDFDDTDYPKNEQMEMFK